MRTGTCLTRWLVAGVCSLALLAPLSTLDTAHAAQRPTKKTTKPNTRKPGQKSPVKPAKGEVGKRKVIGPTLAARTSKAAKTPAPASNPASKRTRTKATLGSQAAGATAPSAPLGSTAAGSRAAAAPLGSTAAGSRAAATPLGSTAAGSTAAGSTAASVPLGSRAAPALSLRLGSQAAPAEGATAPRPVSLAAAAPRSIAARPPSRFRTVVPTIEGNLPRLSSAAPALLFVVGDQSGSMGGLFAGQATIRKSMALSDAVNGALLEFVERHNVGGTIKPRLDVILRGYGGKTENLFTGALAQKDIASLPEVADNILMEIDTVDAEQQPIKRPIWVQPMAAGGTPMRGAFSSLRTTVDGWSRRPAGDHLVLGVHVTDGDSTDGSPADEIEGLARDVQARGGKLLMTNIHLSSNGDPSNAIVFPDAADAERMDAHGQALFEISSEVPASLAARLGTKPGARMMAFNATVEQFARVFEAGSSAAAQ